MKIRYIALSVALTLTCFAGLIVSAADYTGKFDPALVANIEDHERVVFKGDTGARISKLGPFEEDTHFSAARLFDPRTGEYSMSAFLVEEMDTKPLLFVDVNDDGTISADEKFTMARRRKDSSYEWEATITLAIKEGRFTTVPIFVQYLRSVLTDKMTRDDRLILQSTEVMARCTVDVKGKPVMVQYQYSVRGKKISPQTGWLGVDIDGDGKIDMDGLSPEAAKADDESVIFRVGDMYLSTKKVDISKDQIIMRDHEAKAYKRHELYLNREFPEFNFTDFDGKKRKFSEFRGKYVLLDVWGFWCGPCREELPYIREANKRFEKRDLVILGLNTDTEIDAKQSLKNNGMIWTNAQFESVVTFLREGLRINSFPTTFLIGPDGKILSMSRSERDELSLRKQSLLTSLDETLPKR